jgi:WhiB family redox-sensing transcriptional regulator
VDEVLTSWLMTPEAGTGPPAVSLLELFTRPSWMAQGACRGEPVETFIREGRRPAAKARAICAGCPVRAECLAHAVADPGLVGVWGGMTDRERQRLRRGRQAAA